MQICLVLFPDVPALQPLLVRQVFDATNACAGQSLFDCHLRSSTGTTLRTPDGVRFRPDIGDWRDPEAHELLLLCPGGGKAAALSMGLRGFVARAARAGVDAASLGDGGAMMKRLGLLNRQAPNAGSGLALAVPLLHWIGRRAGDALATKTADALGIEMPLPEDQSRPAPRSQDPVLEQMQGLMDKNLSRPLSVVEIAQTFGLSAKQLRHRSQAGLGLTPQQVYVAQRLDAARQMTKATRQSVQQIAAATGFASASSFTRAYRERFGQTPRDTRAR